MSGLTKTASAVAYISLTLARNSLLLSQLVLRPSRLLSSLPFRQSPRVVSAQSPPAVVPALIPFSKVPENIKQVTEAHIQDFADAQTAQMENNTMYDEDNMM